MFGEIVPEFLSGEDGVRIAGFQVVHRGAVADDDFASGPGHFQEFFEVFFDGDPADIECDRLCQIFEQGGRCFRRVEYFDIHAAGQARHFVLEAPAF